MNRIALKMLVADQAKYLALVLGLSFAVLLVAQQSSIFFGLLLRGTMFLQNIGQPDLWVTDDRLDYIGSIRPLDEAELQRVRSVPGVAWASPLFFSVGIVELPGGDFDRMQILGIDRGTLIGRPPEMLRGRLTDLRLPDAIIINRAGAAELGGVAIGDRLKLNDRRAVVVGIARADPGLESHPLGYTTFENAVRFVPTERDRLSYILVGLKSDADPDAVAARIGGIPGLAAHRPDELRWASVNYILRETGIGVNFGTTVALGLVVGLVITTATLYQFASDNLRHFAVLKAIGATRALLVRMILLQAMLVGAVGFGIGVGAASLFSVWGRDPQTRLTTFFPWQLLAGAFVAMLLCVSLGSLLSLRRVLTVEPAAVFQ